MNELSLTIEEYQVIIIPTGGAYGLNGCLTTDEPMVEFRIGGMRFRYNLDTLTDGWGGWGGGDKQGVPKQGQGLCLDGGTRLGVSGASMDVIRAWLRGYTAGFKETTKGIEQ